MTRTGLVEHRVQLEHARQTMQRLELPGDRRARLLTAAVCIAGAVSALFLAWRLS